LKLLVRYDTNIRLLLFKIETEYVFSAVRCEAKEAVDKWTRIFKVVDYKPNGLWYIYVNEISNKI